MVIWRAFYSLACATFACPLSSSPSVPLTFSFFHILVVLYKVSSKIEIVLELQDYNPFTW